MKPLYVRPGLTIPAEYLAVSYSRDLGEDGGPEAARRTPVDVELRLDVKKCPAFLDEERARLLRHPDLRIGRRGTLRVVVTGARSRGESLSEARYRLARLIRRALDGELPSDRPPAEDEPGPRPRRRGAGLVKAR